MKKNEKLHSIEMEVTVPQEEKSERGLITPASIEKMYLKRAEMLSSVSEVISTSLYELLDEKISEEAKELVRILQKEKEFEQTKKARKRLLDDTYFTEKALDITMFE